MENAQIKLNLKVCQRKLRWLCLRPDLLLLISKEFSSFFATPYCFCCHLLSHHLKAKVQAIDIQKNKNIHAHSNWAVFLKSFENYRQCLNSKYELKHFHPTILHIMVRTYVRWTKSCMSEMANGCYKKLAVLMHEQRENPFKSVHLCKRH